MKKKKKQIFYLITILLFFSSCVPLLPGSKMYEPVDWEKSLMKRSNKLAMPSDILNEPELYRDSLIHWVGIIDTFYVVDQDSLVLTRVHFDQKYYDYIEDYSIQREVFFISPYGEGEFISERVYKDLTADSLTQILNSGLNKGDLGFNYGIFKTIESGKPVLEGVGLRIVDKQFYSTEYMSYTVQRDSLGKVIPRSDGFPSLEHGKIEKIPDRN